MASLPNQKATHTMQEVVLATAENLARHAKGAKEQKQSTATNKENLLLESCSTHLTFPVFPFSSPFFIRGFSRDKILVYFRPVLQRKNRAPKWTSA